MALFITAAASAWAVAGTKCDLIAKHCFFDDTASGQSINCVLQGDSDANGPRLDHVIAQTMELSPNHEACPKLNLSPGKKIFFHLLPCEGMFNHGLMFNQRGDLSTYATTLPTEPCNQSTFTIGHALFDDADTVLFSGGIAVQSTVEPSNEHKTSDRPMILRRPGSFGTDGSCNVINNGMSFVSISGVELNNENCVDAEIPASELDGALQKYGPDTMSLVRNSNIFESMANIQPENFHLFDVTLRTSQRYRSAYPGRALVSMDNVRSTVWPPVPVRLDGGYFRNLLDLHNMPRGGPLYANPFYNDSNGTLVLNETKLEEDRISSRPLDMVLWDFQGKITFGRFPEDRKFTVVVFADRDISDIDFADDEVVLDYNITAPSPQGLTLLDASDFYDVAEDEYGCFDKVKPNCDRQLRVLAYSILVGLAGCWLFFHIYTTPRQKNVLECYDPSLDDPSETSPPGPSVDNAGALPEADKGPAAQPGVARGAENGT